MRLYSVSAILLCLVAEAGCKANAKCRPDDVCGGSSTSSSSTSSSGEETGETEGSEGTEADTSSESSGTETETGPQCLEEGLSTEECPAAAPWCVDGACVGCDGDGAGTGAEVDPLRPVCAGGACVQCAEGQPEVCANLGLACDAETNSCVPCEAHADCGDAGCNLDTGECLPADKVWWVDGDNGNDSSPGTEAQPFEHINMAINAIELGGIGTIHVLGTSTPYVEDVGVVGLRTVALLGDGGPVVSGNFSYGLQVQTSSTALVDGLNVEDVAVIGVYCDGGRLVLDNSVVKHCASIGLQLFDECEATVRNSIIALNGGALPVVEPNILVWGSTLEASYLTAVSGLGDLEGSTLDCEGESSVSIRNSILVSAGTDSVECPDAVFEYVVSDDLAANAGPTNESSGSFDVMWFADVDTGDYHLAGDGSTTPFGGVASLQPDDLLTDIDGDPRPMNGFVGADEP